MYGAIYCFFTILLMHIYRKATKVQVKIVLKTSLEHILSTVIFTLIYLPRYFFLILVCFSCSQKLFSKTSSFFALLIQSVRTQFLLLDSCEKVNSYFDKANLFNNFFAKQCTPISNDNTVPVNINFETRERLSFLEFCVDDIVKIIRSLDQNKAHGHDEISVRMIKLCASSISKPLHLIFRNCLETETFLKEWKKGNIISVHKKGDKRLIKNYRPVSLFPICGKGFEKIIFNSLFFI